MDAAEVTRLVQAALPEAQVSVDGSGSRYDITVISDVFVDMRPVKKQQTVYAALSAQIADGTIHAVNIRTFTRDEWAAYSG